MKNGRCLLPLLGLFLAGMVHAQQVDVYARPVQVEPSRDFDVQHYRVSLAFDLDAKTFRGENQVTLVPLRNDWRGCRLHAEGLVVDAVRGADGEDLRFVPGDGGFAVEFPDAFSMADTVQFTVVYHGANPTAGLYFDEETADHPRMVSTDSFPNNARRWVPCYDEPHDKVTHELLVTVPAGEKVLSNGRFVRRTEDATAGTETWHWSMEQPHSTYLFMLAIGPFTVIEDAHGSLPVSYWVYPKDAADAAWIFAATPDMIAFFEELYGVSYPWAKYDQVTTPHVGGGAEATSATVLGHQVIHDRRAEQDYSWERVIAHEIAHQWWGDLTTLRTWSQTWMNESFATYSDYLYKRHAHGADEGAWDLKGKKEQYLNEARTRYMRPIVFDRYEQPGDNFDSHTYPKGAAVLNTLRFILGDEPFLRTLNYFLEKHAFQPVDTHDFMTAVKDATGQNLDWFFDEFVFRPGHPVFEVSYTWDEAAGTLRLRVRQVQDTSNGTPVYRVPVDIGLVTAAGKRVEHVWLEAADSEFTFAVAERPLLVRFDEGNRLLKEWSFPKERAELLYQAAHDDVIGREWAVGQLARFGGDAEVVATLDRLARRDPFWAVRLRALEVFGRIDPVSVVALARTLVADPKSRVRALALRLLGDTGAAEWAPLFRARFTADDSYVAQAAALHALGKCGGADDVPFLQDAATVPSPYDGLRQAANAAIAAIEGRE